MNSKFVNWYTDFGIQMPPGANTMSGRIFTTCPECSHLRKKKDVKCLGIELEEGLFGCNHCGFGGHLLEKKLLDSMAVKPLRAFYPAKAIPEDSPIITWFKEKRKISQNTLIDNNVKISTRNILQKASGEYEKKVCIVFNYMIGGQVYDRKFRDAKKNFSLEKGQERIFYGLNDIRDSDFAIIVEGEIDKLSFSEIGINECVSVPNGSIVTKKEIEHYKKTGDLLPNVKMNLKYLDLHWDSHFKSKKIIYIATDDDLPGIKLRNELIRRFGQRRVRLIQLDRLNCKDPNQVLQEHGPAALKELFDKAYSFPPENVIRGKDAWTGLSQEYDHGRPHGVSTGFKTLDNHFTWRPGDCIALNGHPAEGKSTLAMNLLLPTTFMYDWKWGIYMPENYPARRIFDTAAQILVGNSTDKKSKKSRMTKSEYSYIVNEFLHEHLFIVTGRYTPAQLRQKQIELIEEYGIIGFVKDPWNSLINSGGRNSDLYLEQELSEEVDLCTSREVITLINAHPPTPERKVDLRAPTPFELTGGKIWFAKMFAMLCVHQKRKVVEIGGQNKKIVDRTTSEIRVQKIKEHDLVGVPTDYDHPLEWKFNTKFKRYLEIDDKSRYVSPFDNFKPFDQQNLLEI